MKGNPRECCYVEFTFPDIHTERQPIGQTDRVGGGAQRKDCTTLAPSSGTEKGEMNTAADIEK